MTKEELKEAIASTIIENNQKGITATALANLLNEIVDAAGSGGSGGGAGGGTLMLNLMGVDGPNENNAVIYEMLYDGLFNELKGYNVCVVGEGMCVSILQYVFYSVEDVIEGIAMSIGFEEGDSFILKSDGSIIFSE